MEVTKWMAAPEHILRAAVRAGDKERMMPIRKGLDLPIKLFDLSGPAKDAHEDRKEPGATKPCMHEGWSYDKHGRCCFKCGAFLVDWGD